jgi:hypothetical protein
MIINHPFYQNVRNEIEKKTATRKLFIDIGAGSKRLSFNRVP